MTSSSASGGAGTAGTAGSRRAQPEAVGQRLDRAHALPAAAPNPPDRPHGRRVVLAGGFQGPLAFGGPPSPSAAAASTFLVTFTSSSPPEPRVSLVQAAPGVVPGERGRSDHGATSSSPAPTCPIDGRRRRGAAGRGRRRRTPAAGGSRIDPRLRAAQRVPQLLRGQVRRRRGHLRRSARPSRATLTQASLAVDLTGHAVLGGRRHRGPRLRPGQPAQLPARPEIVVVELDKTGKLVAPWPLVIPASPTAAATGVGVDSGGDVFVTGTFSGALDFGTGGKPLQAAGTQNVFVAGFTAGGATLWADAVPGTGSADGGRPGGPGPTARWCWPARTTAPVTPSRPRTARARTPARLIPGHVPLGVPATALACRLPGTTYGPDGVRGQLRERSGRHRARREREGPSPQAPIPGSGAVVGTGIGFAGTDLALGGYFSGTLSTLLSSVGPDDLFLLKLCPPDLAAPAELAAPAAAARHSSP